MKAPKSLCDMTDGMREINEAIIHCSDTEPEWMEYATADAARDCIRDWHVNDNGWRDIGYHYVIARNGEIAKGRPLGTVGAHCYGHNKHSVGICLLGGARSAADDTFEHNFTSSQDIALRDLLDKLKREQGVKRITGHNEYARKACPGFQVHRWLARRKPRPALDPVPVKLKRALERGGSTGAAGGFSISAIVAGFGGWDSHAQLAIIIASALFALIFGFIMLRNKGNG